MNICRAFWASVFCLGIVQFVQSQGVWESVAFYNVENLFDTEDDPSIRDEEYLPEAGWTVERYQRKLENMAHIISLLATDKLPHGPAIIGLSEVENKKVIEDLIEQPSIKNRGYKIIHFDSPDRRGIDVACIYIPSRFTPLSVNNIPLEIFSLDGNRKFTRDVLHVYGFLGNEEIHLTINHWPSRWGGEKASRPFRMAAAELNLKLLKELQSNNPNVNFIVMGDLNDNPTSPSLAKVLNGKAKENKVGPSELYNPMCSKYKKGAGSNAWNDTWSLFDQILVSGNLAAKGQSYWQINSAHIFRKPFMIQSEGRYKGYPLRTWAGGAYQGGYSDHFPVYIMFKKRV